MTTLAKDAKFCKILTKNEITELCKGVHCVDLGESFQTHIFLQNLASIQPRTSLVKLLDASSADGLASSGAGAGGPDGGPVPASARLRDLEGGKRCRRSQGEEQRPTGSS